MLGAAAASCCRVCRAYCAVGTYKCPSSSSIFDCFKNYPAFKFITRRTAGGLKRQQQQLRRQGSTLAPLHTQTRAGRWTSFSPGSFVHGGRAKCHHKPSILQTHHELFPTHTRVMRHSPCGEAPQQRGSLTPQTQTRPNRLHTHTHPLMRLAHPRSPIPPLSTLTSRATHAHPTSPRSIGFCAIWDCISSSSSSHTGH